MKFENEVHREEQITSHAAAPSEDSWNFSDFCIMLLRWKVTVIGIALVTFVTIFADAYLNAPKLEYEAKAYLSAPLQSQVVGMGVDMTEGIAFRAFNNKLNSRAIRLKYFKNNQLLDKLSLSTDSDPEYVFEERFNKKLSVIVRGNYAYVSFSGTNAKLVAEVVNGFSKLANEEVAREILKDQIQNLKNSLNAKLRNLRSLEEAALTAELAGIKDTLLHWHPSLLWYPDSLLLFARGSKVLRAQIKVLHNKENDAANAHGISNLTKKLDDLKFFLAKSDMSPSDYLNISAMQFLEKAIVPRKAINMPVFKSIMVTALLSAIALGVLAAFFKDFVVRTKKRNEMLLKQKLEG